MPKVTFSSENKVQTSNEYPRLKLEHGERALIVCIEPDPTMEFVHTLRAPEIDQFGNVIKEMKQGKKGEYEATKMEFVGQHLCFGNFDKLTDKGVDPDNCPTCRAAKEEDGIDAPLPRYAMHVVRYGLQPGGWAIRDPFTVQIEAWVFAASRFNILVDLALEWEDLRKHDLKLGPCENKNFQKYDINVSAKAEWLMSDERKKLVGETYKNNQAADLSTLIGRKISREQALEDIGRVQERIAQAYNKSRSGNLPSAAANASASIDADVADLLGDKPKADPWAGTETASEKAASAAVSEPVETSKPASEITFDDVLAGL